uniref:Venom protein n=1 Tax=Elaeophora elaphi TaxID=1147741 RepID=A0A0R3RGD9_9BILA
MEVQKLLQAAALIILVLNVENSDECGEQLQQCAIITEQYEHLIQQSKHSAFRNCINKQICHYELALFENCFERSIRAVRASFNHEILQSDNFIDLAYRYLSALENCFNPMEESTSFSDFKPTLIDEDGIYARTIYSVEFADLLWGLPQLIPTYPYLENSATLACLIREKIGRIFGNGINRFIDSADLKLNNINDSCLLEENEIQCYRRQLSNDRFYQQLLIDRDRILRSCIRSVRLQTQCHSTDASRLRACLCSAREEFENRVQASILQCVRQTHTDHLRDERQQSQRQWHEQRNDYFNKLILNTGKKQYK